MKKLLILSLLLFLALIFTLTIKGNVGNPQPVLIEDKLRVRGEPFELSPERGRYAITMSLAQNKTAYLSPEIARFTTPDLGLVNGKYIVFFSPGVSILAVPLYIIGQKFNLAQVATFTLPALFALMNFFLIVKISQQLGTRTRGALIAGFIYLLATPAFAYSVSFYQHQTTAFMLLATTALLFSKTNFLKLTLATFLAGSSFWIDSQNPIFFIPLLVYAFSQVVKIFEENNKFKITIKLKYLLTISGLLLAILSYVLYSTLTFNKPLQLSGTGRGIASFDSNNQPVLKPSEKKKDPVKFFSSRQLIHGTATLVTSSDRGIVLYTPVILLALLGIPYVYQKEKQKTVVLLGTILFIFTLYAMWGDPYGGWAFGPRYMIPVFGLASIFLAAAFDKFWHKLWFKISFSLLFVYSVAVNLLGALTTNQVPPKVEAVPLGMKWNYLLNLEMFLHGQTSSFFYKTFLVGKLPLYYYGQTIFMAIILVGFLIIWFPQIKTEAK